MKAIRTFNRTGQISKQLEMRNDIITAWKSVLNLVKLQSLVAKCCKVKKICMTLWSWQFLYTFVAITRGETLLRSKKLYYIFAHGVTFLRAQYKSIQKMPTSQDHIFLTLQHFATKLCNRFTNLKFEMLLQAVRAMDFPHFNGFSIFSYKVKGPLEATKTNISFLPIFFGSLAFFKPASTFSVTLFITSSPISNEVPRTAKRMYHHRCYSSIQFSVSACIYQLY